MMNLEREVIKHGFSQPKGVKEGYPKFFFKDEVKVTVAINHKNGSFWWSVSPKDVNGLSDLATAFYKDDEVDVLSNCLKAKVLSQCILDTWLILSSVKDPWEEER